MTQTFPSQFALSLVQPGEQVEICAIQSPAQERRYLLGLGLRPGCAVRVCHGPDAQGIVLQVGSVRVALGRPWLEAIRVRRRLDPKPEPQVARHV